MITNTDDYTDKPLMEAASKKAGWDIDWDLWEMFSPYEKSFFELEFTRTKTVEYYQARLKAIGFENLGRVLDVACGMGQWSHALAALGNKPDGVDLNTGRLAFAADLLRRAGEKDSRFSYALMEDMPFESASLDGIFCYGSFMFGHIDKTLAEFDRLLKPGGRVYLNANTTGWYLHLLIDRGLKGRNLRMIKTALWMTLRTYLGKKQNIIVREDWIREKFKEYGFSVIASGAEGTINLTPDTPLPEPAYPATYYGHPSILEFVLEKS